MRQWPMYKYGSRAMGLYPEVIFILAAAGGAGGLFKLCFECSQCVSGAVLNMPQFLLDC